MHTIFRRELAGLARPSRRCWRCSSSSYAPNASVPPLLLELRADLKNAMRAKDAMRLNVLRGVLADVTNASKTKTPITTDVQLASLLRKKSAACSAAAEDFAVAQRSDLIQKELEQIEILNAYASSVETVPEEELRLAVNFLIVDLEEEGKDVNVGSVMKGLVGPGGKLEGKAVDKGALLEIVKDMFS